MAFAPDRHILGLNILIILSVIDSDTEYIKNDVRSQVLGAIDGAKWPTALEACRREDKAE